MADKNLKNARFGEKGRRLQRSWETLLLLAREDSPLNAKEINKKTHVKYPFDENKCSLQTTREDLKLLIECGFPVAMVDGNGEVINPDEFEDLRGKLKNVRYVLTDPNIILENINSPSSYDISTLAICRAASETSEKFYLKSIFLNMINVFYEKINQSLKKGTDGDCLYVKSVVEIGKKYLGLKISEEILDILFKSIARKQVLRAEYKNRNNEKKEAVFLPLRIWISDKRLYVLTAGAPSKKLFTWRIDKFLNLKEVRNTTAPDIDENEIDESIKKSFKGFVAEPENIKLKVFPEAAYLFREFSYHPTQKIFENNDDSLEVEMTAPLNWALEEWILGFGEFVIVLSPEKLRNAVKARIYKTMGNYDNPAPR